ncbi:MAG TPA: ATP-binding protein [Phycisphaerae bacterium]|nr:ATP-binding protein [Phycisphaerae bacterium]
MDHPSCRILLVEDDPDYAQLLREMLGDAGPHRFTVIHATCLRDALGRLREEAPYDAILLDLSLPDSKGSKTVSRMQTAAPLTPIVVLTSLDDESLGLEAIRIGAQDYLVKGRVDARLLSRAIDYATERKRLLEELRRAHDELERRVRERTADLQRTVEALQVEIVARELAEDAGARLKQQLHQAQKMEAVGQLASGLGHDFGNLLAGILACASRARKSSRDTSAVDKAMDAVEEAVRQANGIVQSLLTFSSQTAARRRPVDLRAVMDESAYLLRHTLPSSVELINRRCEQAVWVSADPIQVEQVLLNLGINARDAMPNGGQLELSLAPATETDIDQLGQAGRRDGKFARLVVRDTGTGIPPEVRSRIFEPYFTTKPRGQGTGLGLSIVHGIMQDLGGSIDVRSQVGKGTTFTILWPCIEPPTHLAAEATPDMEIPEAQGLVVLLVGEDPHSRGLIGASLRLLGFDVVQAGNKAAMEACCDDLRDRLRLVVIDQGTSESTRAGYVREIRSLGIRAPVVVVCNETTQDAEMGDALEAGVFRLRGPFGMPELSRITRDALGIQ